MKLKDDLKLREVAGQYVIIPIGRRVKEVHGVNYLNATGAFLLENIKGREFEEKDLIELLSCRYPAADRKKLQEDVKVFVEALSASNILEKSDQAGWAYAKLPRYRE